MRSKSGKELLLRLLARICVFAQVLIFIGLILPWYISVDARYLRDNFQYLTERYSETINLGNPVNTHGINSIKYPSPISLRYLYRLENEWTGYYIGLGVDSDKLNPWDAVTRLQLQANNSYIQEVYDSILWDMAFFQDNNLEDKTMMGIWARDRKGYQTKATEAMESLIRQYKACHIIFLIMEIPAVISSFYLISKSRYFKHIKNVKRNVLEKGGME